MYSYQNTPGPYGTYPDEAGYQNDLERYERQQIENSIHTRYEDKPGPWYLSIYWKLRNAKIEDTLSFTVPSQETESCEQFLKYLCHTASCRRFKVTKDSKVFVSTEDNLSLLPISDSSDNSSWNRLSIHTSFDKYDTMDMDDKMILEISEDTDPNVLDKITETLQKLKKHVIYFIHTKKEE